MPRSSCSSRKAGSVSMRFCAWHCLTSLSTCLPLLFPLITVHFLCLCQPRPPVLFSNMEHCRVTMAVPPPHLINNASINQSIRTQGAPVTHIGVCWALWEKTTKIPRTERLSFAWVTLMTWEACNPHNSSISSLAP